MRLAIALALPLTLLLACGGDGPAPEPVPFQTMQEDFTRSFPEGTYVFRNQPDMAAAWSAAPQEFGEAKDMPIVDFAQDTVVGVSLGVGIRCNIPIITQVSSHDGVVVVSYKTNLDTGVTTLACLHRWRLTDFARIPATRDAVVFERVSG